VGLDSAVGAVAAIAQLLEYGTSGKLNLIVFAVFAVIFADFVYAAVNWIKQRRAERSRQRKPVGESGSGQTPPQNPESNGAVVITVYYIVIAAATAVFVSVGAVNLLPHLKPGTAAGPPRSASSTPPVATITSPSSTAPAKPSVEFTKPTPNMPIEAGSGVAVSGRVSGLGNETLWLVTKPDAGGGAYYLTDNSPVARTDGSWSFPDTGVGDASDRGLSITYLAVAADAACSAALAQAGDTVDALPGGCQVVAAVPVHVNK